LRELSVPPSAPVESGTPARASGLTEFISALAEDPHRPRLVSQLADGGRTELSGASLTNWTAKVAGLLRDEMGASSGDVAAVLLPPGWQTAPVLLGCWWAGITVTGDDDPSAVAAFVPSGGDADADEVFVVSGHPLGAPATDLADHQRDFTTAVLPQSDRLGAPARRDGSWTAVRSAAGDVTADALADQAAAAADGLTTRNADAAGGSAGGRPVLLSAVAWDLPDGVARTLLAVLAADGTLVQCEPGMPGQVLAGIAAAERVTATLGLDLPGLPRLDHP
jgi:uncharacterized protein (TIGR03089 family)